MKENTIRNAAKALIIKDNRLLVIKNENNSVYYTLPGGGQNHNETLAEALERECLEEVGARVNVLETAFISEFIADNHNNKKMKGFHQVDIFFNCQLVDGPDMTLASETDETQTGYEWIDIDQLEDATLFPMSLRSDIVRYHHKKKTKIYFGDIK